MKKNIATIAAKNMILSIMVAFSLGISFTSCSNGDDDNRYIAPENRCDNSGTEVTKSEDGKSVHISSVTHATANKVTIDPAVSDEDLSVVNELISTEGKATYGKSANINTANFILTVMTTHKLKQMAMRYDNGFLIIVVCTPETNWEELAAKVAEGEESFLASGREFKQKRLSEMMKEMAGNAEAASCKYVAFCLGQTITLNR